MCQLCVSTALSKNLTSGLPLNRRRFLKYASSIAATDYGPYSANTFAQNKSFADIIYRNGSIYPISGQNISVEALSVSNGKILGLGSIDKIMSRANA